MPDANPEAITQEFSIESGWLVGHVNVCTCDGGIDATGYQHTMVCGFEPWMNLAELPGWPTPTPAPDASVIEQVLREHSHRIIHDTPPASAIFGCWGQGCDWEGDSSSIATHQADMVMQALALGSRDAAYGSWRKTL